MTTSRASEAAVATDSVTGVAGVLTAVGVVTVALFPLAVPFLILTAAFTAPLLIPLVALALPVALIAGIALAVRGLGRLLTSGRASRPGRPVYRGPGPREAAGPDPVRGGGRAPAGLGDSRGLAER